MPSIAIELQPDAKQEIIEALALALAETSVVTLKAQNYHWNVTGMTFGPLHALFQEIYEDHFAAQDTLAERMKALDAHVDGRMATYLQRSAVQEADNDADAARMVEDLKSDQEQVSTTLIALAQLADKHGDVVSNDMAIARADVHDKFAWMLRAHLKG